MSSGAESVASARADSAARPRPRRSLWREAPIVLPSALLLFALLGLATLLFYRSAIDRFALEGEAQALAFATRVAELVVAEGDDRQLERHLRLLPPGSALAVLDSSGRRLASAGPPDPTGGRDAAVEAALARAPIALAPRATGRDAFVALAPFRLRSEPRLLRLDLPAPALAAESRRAALLTPLVASLAIAAAVVVLLFFRALSRPYEALLERARAAAGETGVGTAARDELDFLLATFDRALAALGAPGGELAPLAGALGSTLDGGFLLLDTEGRLLVATPAAAELLGRATPARGTPLVEALTAAAGSGDERSGEVANLERALATGSPLPRSTFRVSASEGVRAVGLAVEPLKGDGGRLRGFLAIAADVSESERELARERLAEGLAQLGELSAGVAHELRNGLATLGGWIQLLVRRPLEPEAAECAVELEREARHLARVVEEFLAFARPGTRRAEPIDLAQLVRRAAQSVQGAIPGGVPIETRIGVEPAPIAGDPMLLERALHNLLANAAAASRETIATGKPPEPIVLALAPSPGRADRFRVSIADRGPGIPPGIRERLFEPFVSARPGGVGLGLALARRIVLLHGGEIEAGDRPGGGAEIRVELPSSNPVTEGGGTG